MNLRQRRGEKWFTALYAAHYPAVVRYGIRRLTDADAAADLAQDVFVVAWRRRREVPDHSLPWLYGVARHVLANHRRAQRRHPPPDALTNAGALAAQGGPESAGVIADLRAALARLPEADQEILRLVGWEELTVTEVADVLGCTRTAARVRLHRARRRLAIALTTTAPNTTSEGIRR